MSSYGCIDVYSDERYQRDNDDETDKDIAENAKETLTGDKEAEKEDNIDRVDNKKSDERYHIQKTSKCNEFRRIIN